MLANQLPESETPLFSPVDQTVVARFCVDNRDGIVEAFDAFDRHLVGLEELEIRKWSRSLTETEQLIGAGIVKHEIKQEFRRTAGQLIMWAVDGIGPDSVAEIDGVKYRTHNNSLLTESDRGIEVATVVFGQHEITHQEFQDGFAYANNIEWSRLLLGMLIEGNRPRAYM